MDEVSQEPECEECGDAPATYYVHVDGLRIAMCRSCHDWWENHGILPESCREG